MSKLYIKVIHAIATCRTMEQLSGVAEYAKLAQKHLNYSQNIDVINEYNYRLGVLEKNA